MKKEVPNSNSFWQLRGMSHESAVTFLDMTDFVLDDWSKTGRLPRVYARGRDVSVLMYKAEGRMTDFSTADSACIQIISIAARSTLEEFFDDTVELVPLRWGKVKLYAIHLNVETNALNKQESLLEDKNSAGEFDTLVFSADSVGNRHFVRIPENPYAIFISDRCRQVIENSSLTGFAAVREIKLV